MMSVMIRLESSVNAKIDVDVVEAVMEDVIHDISRSETSHGNQSLGNAEHATVQRGEDEAKDDAECNRENESISVLGKSVMNSVD